MDAETRAALERLAMKAKAASAKAYDQYGRESNTYIHRNELRAFADELQVLLDEKGGGARSTDGTGGETPVTTTGAETLGSHREQAAREGAHVQGEKRKPGPTPPDSAAKIAADLRHYCDHYDTLAPHQFVTMIREWAARVEALGRWQAHIESCDMCSDCFEESQGEKVERKALGLEPSELEVVRRAMDFIEHQTGCIRLYFEGGRPTADGGYEQSFKGVWYRTKPIDESPKCDCGADDIIAALAPIAEKGAGT